MKTTPDGWPVYEDTGERIAEQEWAYVIFPNLGGPRFSIIESVIVQRVSAEGGGVGVIDTHEDAMCIHDDQLLFRHPHNAAAAWLKAVGGEEDK